tara:strand:- start:727 stop:1023 length:297 start_codon:yes stop_codon:yes gene_type:complete
MLKTSNPQTQEQNIKTLRIFFNVTVAAFEMQHSVLLAIGQPSVKSEVFLLNLRAQEEINKENPDLEKVDKIIETLVSITETTNKIPKNAFPSGAIQHH